MAGRLLGLIAGKGDLPRAIAEGARAKGYEVFAIGLQPLVDESLANYVDHFKPVSVGKLGAIIDTLKKSGAKEAVMGGKVPKSILYEGKIKPDLKAVTFLVKLKDRSDDSILLALVNEFAKEGIRMLDVTEFTSELLAPKGLLTEKRLTDSEKKDVDFGFSIAKELGRLDIGQTVIVKNLAIMAVEAIEGTDSAIVRGGTLALSGAAVVKVSKPNQDKRFDYPACGLSTIKAMIEVKARVLAIEAEHTLIIQKDEMLKAANAAGISVIGV
ncbi:LpxI family protein [Candidatus Magnetomonas plexicatena]|uniref:LpxI family protein n=1 Tax=Candidatus Magnetomonas plexicatena TaxID=2552947 RepID=UPI00110143FD|nr:LpxI family protein [Nitrospirales bacterium LBB_01]